MSETRPAYTAIEHIGREAARGFDLRVLPEDFVSDPFRYYHGLRRYDPVHRGTDGSVLLTRHADVLAVYRDVESFSSDKRVEFAPKFGSSPLFEHHTTSLVFNDPPLHTRVRRAIVGALGPRALSAMEPGVVTLVDDLLARAEARGRFDAIDDFAALIPVEVIGNLLRVPREEREPLRGWSLAILGALEPAVPPRVLERGNTAVTEFLDYLEVLVADRKRALVDDGTDVLSRLIKGAPGEAPLTPIELLHNCIFILNAGHETTTNLIGNGVHLLLENPDERARLAADPTLVASAIEECLRVQSPNQLGNRMTRRAVSIGATTIEPGTPVTLCIGGANRDPEVFTEPDRFDVGRSPNPHLAFAHGIHICAGMAVARMEGRIALRALLARFPRLSLDGTPIRSPRVRFRGFSSLPVRF